MTTKEIIEEMTGWGVELTVVGDRLRYRTTRDPLTPEMLQTLKWQKQEIINLLSEDSPNYPLPFYQPNGRLVIPCGTAPKYRWWQDGQTIKETMEEFKGQGGPWHFVPSNTTVH